jgi:transposase InsO family protein
MVASANAKRSKEILWDSAAEASFEKLKELINQCPKLYYLNENYPIVLCTDASDYAIGAYLYQVDEEQKERPIRFLSKTLCGAQLRWSTIEKEAYAIYIALNRMEDLLGGVQFTIKTDHKNLRFLNLAGSNKVRNWKVAIQQFDFQIEYIKGSENIPADTFSRLINRPPIVEVNYTSTLPSCTNEQWSILKQMHEYQGAHWGVDKTCNHLNAYYPLITNKDKWTHMRRDVRDYVRQCATCQKMSRVRVAVQATRFTLASYAPMTKISMDTIGPMEPDEKGNTYIITLIDNFSRYLGLYPARDVSAKAAADALFDHSCRFGYPSQLVTDSGSQYCNQLFTELARLAGFDHLKGTPYSKEENGIVERANKEINRFLRNLIFDRDIQKEWSEYIPLIMKLHNALSKSQQVSRRIL